MKRAAIVLLSIVAVGAAAGFLSYHFFQSRSSPADWLRREYSLNEEESARIVALNAKYGPKCEEMCTRIEQAESRLARLVESNETVSEEIRSALEESDRVRTECRLSMLEHFYAVAAAMPEEKRRKYLRIVLPVVLNPGAPPDLNILDPAAR